MSTLIPCLSKHVDVLLYNFLPLALPAFLRLRNGMGVVVDDATRQLESRRHHCRREYLGDKAMRVNEDRA